MHVADDDAALEAGRVAQLSGGHFCEEGFFGRRWGGGDGSQHLRGSGGSVGVPRTAVMISEGRIGLLNVVGAFEQPFLGSVKVSWGWEEGEEVFVDRTLVRVDFLEGCSPGDGDFPLAIERFRRNAQGIEDIERAFEAFDDQCRHSME